MNRYVLAIIGAIAVFVIIVILVITRLFGGNGEETTLQGINLREYGDTPAVVTYTLQGNIVGQEEFNAVRISVDRNQRTIEQIRGYSGAVINSEIYPNTQPAFNEFLHALERTGYVREQNARSDTERGMCPFGRRYIFELHENNEELSRLWGTSCSRADGSYAGDIRATQRLFEAQIPDYRDFTRNLGLR